LGKQVVLDGIKASLELKTSTSATSSNSLKNILMIDGCVTVPSDIGVSGGDTDQFGNEISAADTTTGSNAA
jgi:hypothetical protein